MSAPGLFETHKSEDCEAHVARSIKGEIQKLWDRTVAHIQQAMEARRHPNGNSEPDFGERLRQLEGWRDEQEIEPRQVIYGHNHPPPRHHKSQTSEILVRVGIGLLTAAIGFAYGRLWDHEHRISVLEGREVPSVRSP